MKSPASLSSASLAFCSASFFFAVKLSQNSITAFTWIRTRSSLVKVSLPDSSKALLKWPPDSSQSSWELLLSAYYLNICNLYLWVETWRGFLDFIFSLIGRFSITRSPERSSIEKCRFPIRRWNLERLIVVASLVLGLRISVMWKSINEEFGI